MGKNGKKAIDMDAYAAWVAKGAIPSPTVSKIVEK
jgi:ribosomal protein S16